MTTGNRTVHLSETGISFAPMILVALLTTSFVAGLLVMSLLTTTRGPQQAAAVQPAAAFDPVAFRAGERAAVQP